MKDDLVSRPHPQSKAIEQRHGDVVKRWERLRRDSEAHKARLQRALEQCHKVHSLSHVTAHDPRVMQGRGAVPPVCQESLVFQWVDGGSRGGPHRPSPLQLPGGNQGIAHVSIVSDLLTFEWGLAN